MKKNLTEPLISEESRTAINNYVITEAYKQEQEKRMKLPDLKKYEDLPAAPGEQAKIQKIPIKTHAELNARTDLFTNMEEYQDKDVTFYKESSAVHEVPIVNVIKTTFYEKKSTIFACILKSASKSFKDIELKELMGIDDYKKLLKLRARNYLAIIKMLYRIYHGHKKEAEMYKVFRTKLFQVKRLVEMLGMTYEYTCLFTKVGENLYPFSKQAKEGEEAKIQQVRTDAGKGNIATDEFVDQDEEEGHNNQDSDNEYDQFFESSVNRDYYYSSYQKYLMREEEKWLVRAKWLENTLELLKCDENLINWFPWFQAKMDQLVDLDVDIKTDSPFQSSSVFYIHKFIQEKLKPFNPDTEYENDAKIQIDKQNYFPKTNVNTNDLRNDFQPILRSWVDVRDKLCLKIKNTEADTDYFLTAFERKVFGNEKTYERRINTGGLDIVISQFNFSQNGKYIQFEFCFSGAYFQLIFSISSQFKEPLLVKSNTSFSGFANHQFYCIKEDKVFQYDLEDYSKVKSYKIPFKIDYPQNFFISTQTDQGNFSYIRRIKVEESEEAAKKPPTTQTHELFIKDQLCYIDQSEKFPDEAIFAMNQSQNAFLVQYWNSANPPQLIVAKYVLQVQKQGGLMKLMGNQKPLVANTVSSQHQFTFVREQNFQFYVKDLFDIDKKDLIINLVPLKKDFLIVLSPGKPSKQGNFKSYVFKNEQYITDCNTKDFSTLSFVEGIEGISRIFIKEESQSNYAQNLLKFQSATYDDIAHNKKDWVWKGTNISILNQQYYACFPYTYFIYNHDQVYMKDLNKPKNEGIYYLNGFLGISKDSRPLTIFSMTYNGKLVTMIPAINSNYDKKSFLLKTHEIKTKTQQSNRYKFEGYLRYRIFAWNQDMVNVLRSWLPEVDDVMLDSGSLDIRILNKHNAIALEKLVDRKCQERFIITAVGQPHYSERNVSAPDVYLNSRQFHNWLFIKQTKNVITAYSKGIRFAFRMENFQELESIFVYPIDEQNDDIYDIYIDTLAQSRVDMYFINSNGVLKRFSAPVQYDKPIEEFTEDNLIYSIESYITPLKKEQGGQSDGAKPQAGAAASKKVDLWETKIDGFIANRVFYSTNCIVDFTPTKSSEKVQTGFKLPSPYSMPDQLQKITLSTNEAKIVGIWKTENQLCFIVSPLLNARQLPLFNQTRFLHPVVPMIDKLNGYTQVFTLFVGNRFEPYTIDTYTHSNHRRKGYNFLKTPYPGILIKYFNGIEQKVLLSEFGEEFEEVIRFKQSLNGQFVVLFGTRKGQKFEEPDYLTKYNLQKKDQYQGIFIYELKLGSIQLIKSFIFAEKDVEAALKIVKEKMDKLPDEIFKAEQSQKLQELTLDNEKQAIENSIKKEKEKLEVLLVQQKEFLQDEENKAKQTSNILFIDASKLQEKSKIQKEEYESQIKVLQTSIEALEAKLQAHITLKETKMNELTNNISKQNEELEKLKTIIKNFNNRTLQKATIPEYVEPEIKGRQYNEYSDDAGILHYSLFYDTTEYNTDIEFGAYNREFYLKKEIDANKAKLKLAASKDPTAKDKQPEKTLKYSEEFLDADQLIDYKKIPVIENLIQKYDGLDLPYIEGQPSEYKNYLEKSERYMYFVREVPNKKVKEGDPVQEDITDYNFQEQERTLIRQIMFNLHLEVGEQGDVFLIERFHNTLYYFYKNLADKDYRLQKRQFDFDFVISSADSSDDYLVVSSNNRYQVFNIDRKADKGVTPFKHDNALIKEQDKIKQGVFYDSKIPPKKEAEKEKEGDKKVVANTYTWTLDNCKIRGSNLMLKVKDNQQIEYFRVFDVKNKINILYIEGSKIAVSGCKQYIWLIDSNQVYDVINGLSTFFMWPGDQISTPGYDSYDLFNVFQDRSIMITLGYLQLSFNYISIVVDQELLQNKFDFINQAKNTIAKICHFQYMFYKIGNNRSILERIFKDDKDKQQIDYEPPALIAKLKIPGLMEEKEKIMTEEEKVKAEDEKQATWDSQIKQLFNMLNFLTENYTVELNNPSFITNFFFSYYFIGKSQIAKPTNKAITQETKYYNIFSKLYMGPGDARTDIIDDILHYVVRSNVPILQFVINTCFLKFLKTANTSQAFQEYLKNITMQTSTMKNLDKFQMIKENDDATVYVDSYDSPIIDDGFYQTFRQEKAPKKDVEIYYIQLGEILNKEGEDLMETLTDEKYLPMMDIPFIQYLVMYQWLKVKEDIQKRLLVPFFILLAMFFLFATFQIDWYKDSNADAADILQEIADEITIQVSAGTYNGSLTLDEVNAQIAVLTASDSFLVLFIYVLNTIGLSGILGYLFFMESRQFMLEPKEYFSELWNVVDLVNYFFCLFVLLFDIFDASIQIIRPMAAICVIILWIKLFYFLRVFDTTARLVRMIFEIVNDMKNFLIVLGIGVVGFANGFYILSQAQKDGLDPFAGSSFIQALIWTYRLSLGDFQLDDFYSLYTIDIIIVWFIFVIASLFVVLVLLNLLIAIMGDTFSRVLENITNLQVREKVMLVAENESLFERGSKFGNSQFLIIIKEKSLEAQQAENWDGQINMLKRQLLDKLGTMQTTIDEKIVDNTTEMKRRFQDFDEKSRKQITMTENKIASTNKAEMDLVFGKIQDMFTLQDSKFSILMGTIGQMQSQMNQLRQANQSLRNIQISNQAFKKAVYEKLEIANEEYDSEEGGDYEE